MITKVVAEDGGGAELSVGLTLHKGQVRTELSVA